MKLNSFSKEFPEVLISEGLNFTDERGLFKKTIFGDKINYLMKDVKEVLCVNSNKNVIRGLHFQNPPYPVSTFVTCIKGEIFDVFLDIRKNSKTYGNFGGISLKESDNKGLFIPEGFAHGYSVLTDNTTVIYLQSDNYAPKFDSSINPLSIDVDWKVDNPIISTKDKNSVPFNDFISLFE